MAQLKQFNLKFSLLLFIVCLNPLFAQQPANQPFTTKQRGALIFLEQHLDADHADLNSFVKDLSKAKIAYFGEKHKRNATQADTMKVFSDNVLPALIYLNYDTSFLECLPFFDSPDYLELYLSFYFSDSQAEFITHLKDTLNLTKSPDSCRYLLDAVVERNIHFFGYSPSPQDLRNIYSTSDLNKEQKGQLISESTTAGAFASARYFIETLQYQDTYHKMFLYGGAVHNNMIDDALDSWGKEFYVGSEITAMLQSPDEYLAVDMISVRWLLSSEKNSDVKEQEPTLERPKPIQQDTSNTMNQPSTPRPSISKIMQGIIENQPKKESTQPRQNHNPNLQDKDDIDGDGILNEGEDLFDPAHVIEDIVKTQYLSVIENPTQITRPTLIKIDDNSPLRYQTKYLIVLP